MMLVASPSRRGPITTRNTLSDRGDDHADQQRALLAEDLAEPLQRDAEVLAAFGRHADAAAGPEAGTTRLGTRSGEQLAVVVAAVLGGAASLPFGVAPFAPLAPFVPSVLMPLPPGPSAIRRSRCRSDTSRGVRRGCHGR